MERLNDHRTLVAFAGVLVAVLTVIAACSPTFHLTLSKDEEAFLAAAREVPLTLTYAPDEVDEAWDRARSFIAQYSELSMNVSDDFLIETNTGDENEANVSYRVSRFVRNDSVDIVIRCDVRNSFAKRAADHNAHILAYYVMTGELPYPRVIW